MINQKSGLLEILQNLTVGPEVSSFELRKLSANSAKPIRMARQPLRGWRKPHGGQYRRHHRVRFSAPVIIAVGGQKTLGLSSVISPGGMFVKTRGKPQWVVGDEVELTIVLNEGQTTYLSRARIAQVLSHPADQAGYGLAFLPIVERGVANS